MTLFWKMMGDRNTMKMSYSMKHMRRTEATLRLFILVGYVHTGSVEGCNQHRAQRTPMDPKPLP